MRKYSNMSYWTVNYTDPITGMITECGNEETMGALTVWVQAHLDELPKGEGRMVKKNFRKVFK